jgi:2-amino-4-hydroxy-6-hydroxymethyldihydropteridine diphosphokinase
MTGDQPTVLVALGSNIDPAANLPRAVRLLAQRVEILQASKVYSSPPVGAPGTPEFYNAVLRLAPRFGPRSLKFGVLRAVESELGRRREGGRNAPRTIDLDLVLFGDRVEHSRDLELPDPDLVSQAHVVVPAAEIAGSVVHPVAGVTLAELAARLESRLTVRSDIALC